jgi:hypothetical protein
MSKLKKVRIWLAIAAGVIVVAIVVFIQMIPHITWTVPIEGTITWLDPEERRASMEFIVPWKGEFVEITADVPEDCPITMDGEPVEMNEIRPGDVATITAKYNKKQKILRPVSVEVEGTDRPEPLPYWPPEKVLATRKSEM